jgi:hypothetical protein
MIIRLTTSTPEAYAPGRAVRIDGEPWRIVAVDRGERGRSRLVTGIGAGPAGPVEVSARAKEYRLSIFVRRVERKGEEE